MIGKFNTISLVIVRTEFFTVQYVIYAVGGEPARISIAKSTSALNKSIIQVPVTPEISV